MNNSAIRTLEILEYIAASGKALGITDISRDLGIPKSSVFDIVHTLHSKHYVEQAGDDGKTYKIGLKAYQIGAAYINSADLYKVAHPILEAVKNAVGETAYLAVEDSGYVVYLDKVESDFPIRSTCSIGSRNLMHVTGIGKAILSGYDNQRVFALTKDRFVSRTQNTITDYETLIAELDEVRKRGYALDCGEDIGIVRCVAAPVRDRSGQVVAAISVSMLESSFTPQKRDAVIPVVVGAAAEISEKLGYIK